LANDRVEGFGVRLPAVTPVPETAKAKLGFEPLDVIVTLPLTEPAAPGANFTVNEVVWPAFSVTGSDTPPTLKPVPVAEAADIVTLLPPEFVRVTD